MTNSSIRHDRVVNAPCSYGAFEITVGVLPNVPSAEEVLASIAGAGYAGTELGPPGYLGNGEELGPRLERHGLALAGGYIPIRFSEPEHLDEDLAAMGETLDLFRAAGASEARPVLADAGAPERLAHPGRAAYDRSVALDDAGWENLIDGVKRAADLARENGFDPTFHHHTATYVEAPWEIERLLERTDIGLSLDTGHLALGGGEPVQALRDWADRVDHVHIKDASREIMDGVLKDGAGMDEAWRRNVFCDLGDGFIDLDGFCDVLIDLEYDGWLVVEQDRIPPAGEGVAVAVESQARNRRWLRQRIGV
jgi:inosose dehydratase